MADDTARFLADSPDRLSLLGRLRDGPASPATLVAALDPARRSIQRNLAAFEDRGWVGRCADGYRLTAVGDNVARTHADYLDRLRRIDEYAPLLSHLDPEHAPDPDQLAGADLVTATEADPQAPIHAYTERLREMDGDRIRVCAPVLSRAFHEAHAALALNGVHTELLLSASTAQQARELNPVEFAAVLRAGPLDLFVRDDPIPFGMALGENSLLLGAYDDGHLQACLHSRGSDLLGWAGRAFEALAADARRIRGVSDLGRA
jgi:predicted transcriptional regulator